MYILTCTALNESDNLLSKIRKIGLYSINQASHISNFPQQKKRILYNLTRNTPF